MTVQAPGGGRRNDDGASGDAEMSALVGVVGGGGDDGWTDGAAGLLPRHSQPCLTYRCRATFPGPPGWGQSER